MSKTTNTVMPRLICRNADRAIAFYQAVFDAQEIDRYTTPEGTIVQASVSIFGSIVALAEAAPDWGLHAPDDLGGSPVLLMLNCEDPDEVAAKATENGGTVVIPICDQFYGHRTGRIRDPFGHLWILWRLIKEMTPEEIQRASTTSRRTEPGCESQAG